MKRINFDDGEIFEIYSDLMDKKGLNDKKAEYLYPENTILDTYKSSELEVSLSAAAATSNKMYGVTSETGEDLVDAAHPKGGFVVDVGNKVSDDLNRVETICERHEEMADIATRMPKGKLASFTEALVKVADALDAKGFVSLADQIEHILGKIADVAYDDVGGGFKHPDTAKEYGAQPVERVSGDPGKPAALPTENGYNFTGKEIDQTNIAKVQAKQEWVQKMINSYFTRAGIEEIPVSGVMDGPTQRALRLLDVKLNSPGQTDVYKTWGEFATMVDAAGKKMLADVAAKKQRAEDLKDLVGQNEDKDQNLEEMYARFLPKKST